MLAGTVTLPHLAAPVDQKQNEDEDEDEDADADADADASHHGRTEQRSGV